MPAPAARRPCPLAAIADPVDPDHVLAQLTTTSWRTPTDGKASLWVPETRRTSRDLLILVEQYTESVAPPDVGDSVVR